MSLWALGGILIACGIFHEIGMYLVQLYWRLYSRVFPKYGFIIFAIQLGSIWIAIGFMLLWLLSQMEHVSWHQSVSFKFVGLMIVICGAVLMLLALRDLGWQRMMKSRLFVIPEPKWVTHGVFQYFQNPMYQGSQLMMFGIAWVLDSLVLVFFTLEMLILQKLQSHLENQKLPVYS